MRVRVVGFVLLAAFTAAGLCLWMTWDTTRTSASDQVGAPAALSSGEVRAQERGDGVARDRPGTTSARAPAATTTTTASEPTAAACTANESSVEGDPLTQWATVVVDTAHRLPADFEPPDLVDIGAAGFPGTGADRVRQIVIGDLGALRQAALDHGTPIAVVSAYRSFEYQQSLYEQRVIQEGFEQAAATTARPGHSEHQLGTTIDVLDLASAELTTAFADTPAGRWIAEHAHEYGFVLSYPNEGRDQTCYDFEPWHLRYVGRDIAAQIHTSGLTPRAWMLQHPEEGG